MDDYPDHCNECGREALPIELTAVPNEALNRAIGFTSYSDPAMLCKACLADHHKRLAYYDFLGGKHQRAPNT